LLLVLPYRLRHLKGSVLLVNIVCWEKNHQFMLFHITQHFLGT